MVVRRLVGASAERLGFGTLDRTRIATAASELARNVLVHGGGGRMAISERRAERAAAIELVFDDDGPGIDDLERALTDGYSTAGGLGVGLGGARRLMDEFAVERSASGGLRVTVTKWIRS